MVINQGRQIQFINGIQGVSAGGNAIINMDVNKRYHRNKLQCACVNYTGGTGLAVTKITGSGTGATVTPTIVNGVVTAVTVVAGGSGWTVGDTFTFTDATGTGFVGTVATVTGGPPGALTTATVTSGGTASPANPATVLSSLQQVVNGVIVRDISVTNIIKICQANGVNPQLGELPLYYTEPWFNVNQLNEVLSWDMAGQSTFALRFQISNTVSLPSVIGVQEFDTMRNVRPVAGKGLVPFLQPVAMHEYTFNVAAGLSLINTIPFDYPIRRMWIQGSTAGQITQLEVDQDGNKVFESTFAQMQQDYQDYGFFLGKPSYLSQNIGSVNALKAAFNPLAVFDFAYISDPDQRINKVLTCEQSLVLRITSAIAQSVTVVVESLPGNYAS